MEMRWRITAECPDGRAEVVLADSLVTARFISRCFKDAGHQAIAVTELPPPAATRH